MPKPIWHQARIISADRQAKCARRMGWQLNRSKRRQAFGDLGLSAALKIVNNGTRHLWALQLPNQNGIVLFHFREDNVESDARSAIVIDQGFNQA